MTSKIVEVLHENSKLKMENEKLREIATAHAWLVYQSKVNPALFDRLIQEARKER